MTIIYIIIFAIGIVFASTEEEFFPWLWKMALMVGGLYLAFWIVVIVIGLFSNKNIRETTTPIIGYIFLLFAICYYLYNLYGNYKKGKLSVKIIKENIIKGCKNLWKNNPKITIFLILSFTFIVIMTIYSFTVNGFWQ